MPLPLPQGREEALFLRPYTPLSPSPKARGVYVSAVNVFLIGNVHTTLTHSGASLKVYSPLFKVRFQKWVADGVLRTYTV